MLNLIFTGNGLLLWSIIFHLLAIWHFDWKWCTSIEWYEYDIALSQGWLMLLCRIIFGNMAVIGFLSMWLANIATCAMMIPIAAAVLDELNAHRLQQREEEKRKRCELYSIFPCITQSAYKLTLSLTLKNVENSRPTYKSTPLRVTDTSSTRRLQCSSTDAVRNWRCVD